MVSVDFFTVHTIWFETLFVFVVLAHDRRRILHFNVTVYPTAEWTAHQIVEAFPFDSAPKYCEIAIGSTDTNSASNLKPWTSTKSSAHLDLPGNGLTSNA